MKRSEKKQRTRAFAYGFHVSKTGVVNDERAVPIERAIARDADAHSIGCAQIYTHGPRNHRAVKIDHAALLAVIEQRGLRVYAHTPYVSVEIWKAELGTPSGDAKLARFEEQLRVARACGLAGVVLHTTRVPFERIAEVMRHIRVCAAPHRVRVLLEMPAAKSTAETYETPEKMNALTRLIGAADWWGWCVDTAHLWACGVDMRGRHEFAAWLAALEHPELVRVFHLNGSMSARGCGSDKHDIPFADSDEIWAGMRSRDSAVAALCAFAAQHRSDVVMEINRGRIEDFTHALGVLRKLSR